MKLLAMLLPALVLVVACGGSGDATGGMLASDESAASEVSICSCVDDPISTSERAEACAALMDSMSQQEAVEATLACRAVPPADGPDLCFCVQTSSTDPEVMQACEALIPEDLSRTRVAALITDCARKGN